MSLPLSCLHAEVQTAEGSICDLVGLYRKRVRCFELKMSSIGEVSVGLDARALRQLRHYRASADEVWLVTLAAPRVIEFHDDRVVVRDPMEAQLLPDGVGWLVYDTLTRTIHAMRAATPLEPDPRARAALVDAVVGRLSNATRQAQGCR